MQQVRRILVLALALVLGLGAPGVARAAATGPTAKSPVVTGLSVARGYVTGGSVLMVSGRRFDHVRWVAFGATHSTRVTTVSSTRLRVLVPQHLAGTVQVRVHTRSGSSTARPSSSFAYDDFPVISGLDHTDGPAAGGQRITLRGTRFERGVHVRFGTVYGTAVRVSSRTRVTVTTPRHQVGVSSVRVVFAGGASSSVSYRFGTPATTQWSPLVTVDPGQPAMAVSCPTTGFCAATDGGNSFLNKSSGSWTAPARAAGGAGVSCSSATFCMSVGEYLTFRWDGTSWTRVTNPFPDGSGGTRAVDLRHVDCTSVTFCLAAGSGQVSTWNGSSWSDLVRIGRTTTFGGYYVDAVSCWSDGRCVADTEGGALLELDDDRWTARRGWYDERSDSIENSLACPNATRCFVGLRNGTVVTWTPEGFVATPDVLPGAVSVLDCTGPDSCVAAGNGTAPSNGDALPNGTAAANGTATWNGTAWSVSRPSPLTGEHGERLAVTGVSCAVDRHCTAVGAGYAAELTW